MNYVIGDIHGESTKLASLTQFLVASDPAARLIYIGDYLDKGEDSRAVLRQLTGWATKGAQHLFLRGNHEYMWERARDEDADAIAYLTKYGGLTTAEDFGARTVKDAIDAVFQEGEALFAHLRDYAIVDDCFIAHAGVDLGYRDSDLASIPTQAFLFNRYEFIQSKGSFFGCALSVFGHTGFYSPYRDPFKIGLDTAAAYLPEQPLTAYCTTNDRFYTSQGKSYRLPLEGLDTCPVIPRVTPYRITTKA